jgi:hypothetical protein
VEVVLDAELGQSLFEVDCNPERDVVILNFSHEITFFDGRTPFSIYIGVTFDPRVGAFVTPWPSPDNTLVTNELRGVLAPWPESHGHKN